MKNILILTLAFFINTGVYSNNCTDYINSHDELVEKLSNNKDVHKLSEYGMGMKLIQMSAHHVNKETGEISEEVVNAYNSLAKESNILYAKIESENPDFKKLNPDDKVEVLTEVFERRRAITAKRVLQCLTIATGTCMGGYGAWNRASFWICMGIAGCTDLAALWASGGTAAPFVGTTLAAQAAVCETYAQVAGAVGCIVTFATAITLCLQNNT